MKRLPYLIVLLLSLLASCGEDRSGEQPFAPTVKSISAVAEADSAHLSGEVTASPNSTLTECGFAYGNDTLRANCKAPAPTSAFTAVTDSLGPGRYFAVAYARNGVGTSWGDTIYFNIEDKHKSDSD